jgi:hypothetical protein
MEEDSQYSQCKLRELSDDLAYTLVYREGQPEVNAHQLVDFEMAHQKTGHTSHET